MFVSKKCCLGWYGSTSEFGLPVTTYKIILTTAQPVMRRVYFKCSAWKMFELSSAEIPGKRDRISDKKLGLLSSTRSCKEGLKCFIMGL